MGIRDDIKRFFRGDAEINALLVRYNKHRKENGFPARYCGFEEVMSGFSSVQGKLARSGTNEKFHRFVAIMEKSKRDPSIIKFRLHFVRART